MSGIIEGLENIMKPVKNFIVDNQNNPIFWLILFGLGILFFVTLYNALQKEK